VTWQGHFQVGFDESEVSRVSVESMDTNDEVNALMRKESDVWRQMEVWGRRGKPGEIAETQNALAVYSSVFARSGFPPFLY
jgi:hypothetical protein